METSIQKEKRRELLSQVVIGLPDGITIPFVLATALSAVTPDASVILIAGMAAVITGALTMGFGAYFTNRTESRHFNLDLSSKELKERNFLSGLGIGEEVQNLASEEIIKERERWGDLLKHRNTSGKSVRTAMAMAFAYLTGGMIPLIPYFTAADVPAARIICTLLTFAALIVAGYLKGRLTSSRPLLLTLRILLSATIAGACAYGVATLVNR